VGAPVASLPTKRALDTAERSRLVEYYNHCREMGHEWLRRQILRNNRIDILATAVLGYEVKPFHLAMMRFQFAHPDNLQLAFRGAGKSTTCTITKSIHLLLKDPNLRIILASKTAQNSESFLKEIKSHFEGNDLLIELFGSYYDPRKVNKWDNREIEVLPRTSTAKESSITCVGVEGTVVSKHYDVAISDDLVDEDNSRTLHQRNKTRTWYYQTLDPTIEPPSPNVPHRGEHHRQGTRYHWDDLYGHLIANELKSAHHIVPGLDETGRSPWPERYPARWFLDKRAKAGLIIYNAQYQCDTEAMKGEIFQYDDCQQIDPSEFPPASKLQVFMGVDLAISEKDSADKFAIVVIGTTRDRSAYYVLDYYEKQLRFKAQTEKIVEFHEKWDPIRIVVETQQYQEAQYQTLQDDHPGVRVRPKTQHRDKLTRAWKLSAIFENKRVFFKKTEQSKLIEHLVLFPGHRYKDLFDAFDLAVGAGRLRKRRKRKREPGVI